MHATTFIAALSVAASVVVAAPSIAERSVNTCWLPSNKAATDRNVPVPGRCNNAGAVSFPAYNQYSTGSGNSPRTDSHVSVGPWHCCATCANDPTCTAWIIYDDCTCFLYHDDQCTSGSTLASLSQPTAGNSTGTFHTGGCKVAIN